MEKRDCAALESGEGEAMKTIIILVYIFNSTWRADRQEYVMPDMATCIEAAKAAKVVAIGDKGSTAVFCAAKESKQ